MLRFIRAIGPSPRRRWRADTGCRRGISSQFCRHWCTKESLGASGGPRGGYELGREGRQISAEEILRAAGTVAEKTDPQLPGTALVRAVVLPALAQAERAFAAALSEISIDGLARRAESART